MVPTRLELTDKEPENDPVLCTANGKPESATRTDTELEAGAHHGMETTPEITNGSPETLLRLTNERLETVAFGMLPREMRNPTTAPNAIAAVDKTSFDCG